MALKHLKGISAGAVLLLLSVFVALSIVHSHGVSAIHIKLLEGKTDHFDKVIPFISPKGEREPDYKLRGLFGDEWHYLGTRKNQSAVDWLTYEVTDGPSLALLREIQVIEDDGLEDDLLDTIQIASTSAASGNRFQVRIDTRRSFTAGMSWFFSTPVGKAVLAGITLAIVLLIASSLPF